MELQSFIAETLKSVVLGVAQAQKELAGTGAIVNPRPRSVNSSVELAKVSRDSFRIESLDFDVAVTTTDQSDNKGGFGIFVGPVGAGAQGATATSNQSSSRIRFSVPLVFAPGEAIQPNREPPTGLVV